MTAVQEGFTSLQQRFDTGRASTGFGAYGTHELIEHKVPGGVPVFLAKGGIDVGLRVAKEFVNAGTDVLPSPTFGPTEDVLLAAGHSHSEIEAGKRDACRATARFAGSVGVSSTVVVRPPRDCYRLDPNALPKYEEELAEQVERYKRALRVGMPSEPTEEETPDYIAETIPLEINATALLLAAKELKIPGSRLNISWYAEVRDGQVVLADGTLLADAVGRTAELAEELVGPLNSMGLNCVTPLDGIPALKAIAGVWGGWITYAPNAFPNRPYDEAHLEVVRQRAAANGRTAGEQLRAEALQPENLGPFLESTEQALAIAQVVLGGGCCFVGPEAIAHVHRQVDAANQARHAAGILRNQEL